jgi:hypothetical protein
MSQTWTPVLLRSPRVIKQDISSNLIAVVLPSSPIIGFIGLILTGLHILSDWEKNQTIKLIHTYGVLSRMPGGSQKTQTDFSTTL